MNKNNLRNLAATALLAIGLLAMLGELIQSKKLKALALATQCAPYTKVFSLAYSYEEQQPFETFASHFTLHYKSPERNVESINLTPEVYSQLKGPYNRRNVYGAILAYGPALPTKMRQHCLSSALTSDNSITEELGIPKGSSDFTITITPKNNSLPQQPFTLCP